MAKKTDMQNTEDETEEVIKSHQQKLQKRVRSIEARLTPLYAEKNKVLAQINKLNDRLNEMMPEIKEIELEELAPARNELARVARAGGARGLGDTTG